MTDVTLAQKIEALREHGLYSIGFRNAGVGLMFYEGPRDEHGHPGHAMGWQRYLRVEGYHPTLEAAVEAEYARKIPHV